MTSTIDEIKNTVKSHTVIPFTARDITCETINKHTTLIIDNKYAVQDTSDIMETFGIRSNLTKNILSKPEENWGIMKVALDRIDQTKVFHGIVDRNNSLVTVTKSNVKAPTQLDYDSRIDQLMTAIMESKEHNFQNIFFDPGTCTVDVNVTNLEQIDCGLGDLWNFGTTTTVGLMNQQFKQFFNRLICTNGMTTKEGIAYRMVSDRSDIGKQFLKYSDNRTTINSIRPRVNRLRNSRASLYEVNSVANCLSSEDKDAFFPAYGNMVQDFLDRGHVMKDISAKRQKFMYTNENLYDIFNLATDLASHQRTVIGDSNAIALNKVAGDIFTRGPGLEFNVLDIYKQ